MTRNVLWTNMEMTKRDPQVWKETYYNVGYQDR